MMLTATPTTNLVGEKKILVLGFPAELDSVLIEDSLGDFDVYRMSNSFTAFRWLIQQIKKSPTGLSLAILVNVDFIKKEKFLFLENLTALPIFSNIPLIAYSKEKLQDFGFEKAKKLGVDDHYVGQLDFQKIRTRLDFLFQYKKFKKQETISDSDFEGFKIPIEKRIFDILIASILLLCLSPILLIVALAVKLESKGPIIYKSKRVGTGYQIFHFLKFRSMFQDADQRLAQMMHLNRYGNEKDALFLKFENDPRVTKVGKFIRKTSLDELPQLINVLKGEMSIVGNRPLPLYEAEQLTRDEWANRFLASAGITGLWQVSPEGKDTMSVEKRVALDVEYAKNYSLALDIIILLRTLPAMMQKSE